MQSIKKIKDIKGKRVIVRVDFNVPIKDGKVEDDFRIKKALPTIEFLKEAGAKIILISHLGKGGVSLAPVAKALSQYFDVIFVSHVMGEHVTKAVAELQDGQILLLENLRNEAGEQSGDKIFAMNLAKLGDIYVNDAFSVSHREDASVVLLPKLLPGYAGFQLEEEVKNLSHVLEKPKHPFLFILGGAKFSTKMPLIKKYLSLSDHIFIGGALANDFLKAKGYEIGKSLIDVESYGLEEIINNEKIILPVDVLVTDGKNTVVKKVDEIKSNEIIIDIGPESVKILEPYITKSKMVLWNGPLGKYEAGGAQTTKDILKYVAASKAESIIGGGDTVSVISELKMEKDFSFVSTGGGATLDFLSNGTLPGITALQ